MSMNLVVRDLDSPGSDLTLLITLAGRQIEPSLASISPVHETPQEVPESVDAETETETRIDKVPATEVASSRTDRSLPLIALKGCTAVDGISRCARNLRSFQISVS
jgi:hypothetical protein